MAKIDEKWYGKFYKHSAQGKKSSKQDFQPQTVKKEKSYKQSIQKLTLDPDAEILNIQHMFSNKNINKDTQNILENFDTIIQGIKPLNSKQILKLPKDIKKLSHKLTDERDTRRIGYMNSTEELSAYVRYFSWWNLLRLVKLFSNIDNANFSLKDKDICLDIGSGPLTIVIALWLAKPELRNLDLTWYCLDISSTAMALGEDLYLSIAAKTPPPNAASLPHWKIIRIKGEIGTLIKQKAQFITSANMFNEISQNSNEKPEQLADVQIKNLLLYADNKTTFFIAEPGTPPSARFISLLRERFIEKKYMPLSPCTHSKNCPMNGLHARRGGTAKWCNFGFMTEDAPSKLVKLSEKAGIPKDRAVISYLLTTNTIQNSSTESKTSDNTLQIRIASGKIHLPPRNTGFYGCTEHGLILAVDATQNDFHSGDKLTILTKKNIKNAETDKKSGAKKLTI